MLPFYGRVAIGYIPRGRVAGLSKLARTVEVYARRLQLQEQLTAQIADALMEHLAPEGAIVLIEAEHMCMTMRGVQKPGTTTVTLARRGCFESDPAPRGAFLPHAGALTLLASMPRVDAIWANPLFQEKPSCHRSDGDAARLLQARFVPSVGCGAYGVDYQPRRRLSRSRAGRWSTPPALLHDIGRAAEYSEGISHDVAGVEIACRILGTVVAEQRFSSAEAEAIVKAVRGHRADDVDAASCELSSLSSRLACVIAEADHRSRPCFACSACATCYWPEEKKNMAVRV